MTANGTAAARANGLRLAKTRPNASPMIWFAGSLDAANVTPLNGGDHTAWAGARPCARSAVRLPIRGRRGTMSRRRGGAATGRMGGDRDGSERHREPAGRLAGRVLIALALLLGPWPPAARRDAARRRRRAPTFHPRCGELLNLLADPGVQRWLDQHRGAAAAAPRRHRPTPRRRPAVSSRHGSIR